MSDKLEKLLKTVNEDLTGPPLREKLQGAADLLKDARYKFNSIFADVNAGFQKMKSSHDEYLDRKTEFRVAKDSLEAVEKTHEYILRLISKV